MTRPGDVPPAELDGEPPSEDEGDETGRAVDADGTVTLPLEVRELQPPEGRLRGFGRARTRVNLEVLPQPTNTTCGPTCLHAVYRFYGDHLDLDDIITGIEHLDTGGTLAVNLACHALERGYRATIVTYNLQLFDPTWFNDGRGRDIVRRMQDQMRAKDDAKLATATRAYLSFFELGGRLEYRELTAGLIRRHLNRGVPILTGLSATYLYGCARERDDEYDDVRGEPTGHFVVLAGYDPHHRTVRVADPLHDNPGYASSYYDVHMDRLKSAILLGIVTYDANLLIIEPQTTG